MKSIVVQISGKQGSGKTTLAHSLMNQLMSDSLFVCHHIYAKVIYEMHDAVLAIMRRYGEVPRKDGRLLQVLGTEWGRTVYGPDVWVNVIRQEVARLDRELSNTLVPVQGIVHIISDCRMPNEHAAFPGALTYRLSCPDEIRKERVLATPGQSWREGNHPSESALDSCTDFTRIFPTHLVSVEEITRVIVGDIKLKLEEK